jgi:glycosyltransferase involved in cell wall biosynthesis
LARLAGVRTIFSAAFDRDVTPRSALSWRRRWWPLYAAGLSLADRIFLQHSGQLSALPGRWRAKARIVRSIAASEGAPTPHADRDGHVAWVGMLRQPKRPDVLIEIARRLPLIRFVVCGGTTRHRSPETFGEDVASRLRALPNVTYLGQVPPDRCREVVSNASVLLSTSDEEGFPNTFLEAWSNGTPVVSLHVDPDGVIEQKGLGTVSRGVERAAADVSALVMATSRREAIGVRARRYVAECHSEQVVVEAFERAICETGSHWSHERPRIAF